MTAQLPDAPLSTTLPTDFTGLEEVRRLVEDTKYLFSTYFTDCFHDGFMLSPYLVVSRACSPICAPRYDVDVESAYQQRECCGI